MGDVTISSPDSIRVEMNNQLKSVGKTYVVDLRVNTPGALSYFNLGKLDTAPAMVRLAKAKGLDAIAITDYYSAAAVDRVKAAAKGQTLTVLPGVMIRASLPGCNEVMLCCVFPETANAADISHFLQRINVPASAAYNRDYVVTATLKNILEELKLANAIVFASRMDKTPYRKAAIKTLIEDYGIRAFDLAYYDESCRWFKQTWPKEEFAMFSFSNANALAQVGNRSTAVNLKTPDFRGLKGLLESL